MRSLLCAAGFVVAAAPASHAHAADAKLPAYQTVANISGTLKSTLSNEMSLWAKGFQARYPEVTMEVEGKGSATAPPALLAGLSQFAPMSRPMTAEESDAFEKKYGYKASGFRVAIDALAVYVHKDNPIPCLPKPAAANRMFSSTSKVAFGGDIRTWGELGLTGLGGRSPSRSTAATPSRAPTNSSGTWP
jgi:phosphate transport system substrate-binding protein